MVSTPDVENNIQQAQTLICEAVEQQAQLLILPEYFPIIGHDEEAKLSYQEPFGDGPLQAFLADNARKHGIWLIGGSVPLQTHDAKRVSNSCLMFNPDGECIGRYDKIHLFDVSVSKEGSENYNESNTIIPGGRIVVADTPFGKIGLSICYDLRFPELYRQLTEQDAVILSIPSAFTETTGRLHWEMLLRCRAVENLCYVIAPNQGGQNTPKRKTWGHSMIIDPWGDILCSMEKGTGVVCADLDLARQQDLRRRFPALEHRRV